MASFVFGMVIGAYTGAMIREEYYFPTPDKIQQAFKIYKENEAVINQSLPNGSMQKTEQSSKLNS